jgi:predicted PurR-regulated permease PerM
MTKPADAAVQDGLDAQTFALRIIAGLLVVGTAWLLAGLLVPFFLALVLAIALAPVMAWLVGKGVPRAMAGVLCVLAVAAFLGLTIGLILFQTGSIIQDSDKYLRRFSDLLASGSHLSGSDHMIGSFGLLKEDGEAEVSGRPGVRAVARPGDAPGAPAASWDRFLRRNVRSLAQRVGTGLGGLLGFVGGVVLFLAFLFYMLMSQEEWIDRLTLASARLGMRPRHGELVKVQQVLVRYIGCLALVSLAYMVLVSLVLGAVGVPQPLLWGVLAGLLETLPYFGPLIASILPTIVALTLGSWWQPAVVIAMFLGLHLVEGYIVTPLLYGRVIDFNPVTILFGALFFGWIWGPLGITLAMPMMILLRGLLVMAPEAPALDALADVEGEKAKLHGAATRV